MRAYPALSIAFKTRRLREERRLKRYQG